MEKITGVTPPKLAAGRSEVVGSIGRVIPSSGQADVSIQTRPHRSMGDAS
jgi:hypothetical protein